MHWRPGGSVASGWGLLVPRALRVQEGVSIWVPSQPPRSRAAFLTAGCSWLPRSSSVPDSRMPATPTHGPQGRVPSLGSQAAPFTCAQGHTQSRTCSQPAPRPREDSARPQCEQLPGFITDRLRLPGGGRRGHQGAGAGVRGSGLRAAGHRMRLRQAPQRGRTGRHVCWPKPTNSPLISPHSSL